MPSTTTACASGGNNSLPALSSRPGQSVSSSHSLALIQKLLRAVVPDVVDVHGDSWAVWMLALDTGKPHVPLIGDALACLGPSVGPDPL